MAEVVPEQPPASNRGLWMLVIGLGIAILLVVAAMIGMAIRNAYSKGPETSAPVQATLKPGEAPELNLDLEPGATVSDAKMDGSLLIVRVTSPVSDEVLVIDPAKSKIINRIRFNRKAP
ncbi:MAG: hypothetical protein ABL973_11135 [Micropepsaceae bacterium]